MKLSERIQLWVNSLPSDSSSITLTRADLVGLLEEWEADSATVTLPRDLTVEEVAEKTQRAPSTVRGWLLVGQLRGYKLNNRDWRIPRAALREYLEVQSREPESDPYDTGPVDIAAWRRLDNG